MISTQVLAMMRRRAQSFMTGTCTLLQEDDTVDSAGAPTNTWSVVASGVACRLLPVGRANDSATEVVSNAERLTEEYRLIVPHDTTLTSDMRVVIDADTYDIVRILDSRTSETDRQAVIVRFEDGV